VGLGFAGLMMGALIVQVNYMAKAINSAQSMLYGAPCFFWRGSYRNFFFFAVNLPSSPDSDDFVQGCVVISVDSGIFFANMISFSVVDTSKLYIYIY
jgi:hypothetical protein